MSYDSNAQGRLAAFLFEDDWGETMTEHENGCELDNCELRGIYLEFAAKALWAIRDSK